MKRQAGCSIAMTDDGPETNTPRPQTDDDACASNVIVHLCSKPKYSRLRAIAFALRFNGEFESKHCQISVLLQQEAN